MRVCGMHDARVDDCHEEGTDPCAGLGAPNSINIRLRYARAAIRRTDGVRIVQNGRHVVVARSIIVHAAEASEGAAAESALERLYFVRDMCDPAPKLLSRDFIKRPDTQI